MLVELTFDDLHFLLSFVLQLLFVSVFIEHDCLLLVKLRCYVSKGENIGAVMRLFKFFTNIRVSKIVVNLAVISSSWNLFLLH